MPSYSLSLPILLALFVFFTIVGGGLAYLASSLGGTPEAAAPTSFVLATDTIPPDTPVPTDTPQPTITNTFAPPPTLEPIPYTVQSGDTCAAIAGFFNISSQALITSNGLSVNCYLVEGQTLLVPQPTPLPTTEALATQAWIQTQAACPIDYVTVQAGDTIEVISQFTRVPAQEILSYNGKASNLLFEGEVLAIPTCKETTDLSGATYTPSPAPSYAAAELLQPPTGAYFGRNDEIILQWLAASELRENEYFLLTIVDSTDGGTIVLEQTVKDTRFILDSSYRPSGNTPHVLGWKIGILAQIGEDAEGAPIYREAGPDSETNYFAWGN
ncbi:MAG TPA: LysM peptidoglycan-binding domain-containing protein [Anaerolineales bacterium]|nr:LysM peptidoglycan-binding domain-containing protein [Anaerolineales bacterium]